jgi:hypothetical protein
LLIFSQFVNKNSSGDFVVQGKVLIRRDAGQVVAGDAVTHIQTYNAHASRSLLAVAFFSG